MESLEDRMNSGRWWEPTWWDDPALAADVGLSVEDLHKSFAILQKYFDADWTLRALQAGGPNPVLRQLLNGTGLWPLQWIVGLSRVMGHLEDTPSLRRKISDLVGQKSQSSFFEICVASRLASAGGSIDFIPESNARKTPDLKVCLNSLNFDVECKHLGTDQWQIWVDQLQTDLILDIGCGPGWEHVELNVELNSRLSELHIADRPGDEGYALAIRNQIASKLKTALRMLDPSSLPIELELPGLARIWAVHREAGGVGGSVGGIQISPVASLRKVLVNGVLPAMKQLMHSDCGVIAIHTEHAPDQLLLQVAMDGLRSANPSGFRRIAGIAVFPQIGSRLSWVNPQCDMASVAMDGFA